MARQRGAEPPAEPQPAPEPAPAEPASQPAEPTAAAVQLRSAAEAEQRAKDAAAAPAETGPTFTVRPAAAPAEAKKKPTARQGELSIMQQIARRMKRLPSDAARARVAGWFAEEYAAKGGEPS